MLFSLRIGVSNLVDDLDLIEAVQKALELLQSEPGHGQADGLQQYVQLLLKAVVPQQNPGAQDELAGDVIIRLHDALQLCNQLQAPLPPAVDAAGDDLRLKAGDLDLVFAEQGKVPVIRQAQALEQGAETGCGRGSAGRFQCGRW